MVTGGLRGPQTLQMSYLRQLLSRREVFGGIEIVFVGSAEADAFIAQEAQNLRRSGCPYVRLLFCPVAPSNIVICNKLRQMEEVLVDSIGFAKDQQILPRLGALSCRCWWQAMIMMSQNRVGPMRSSQ